MRRSLVRPVSLLLPIDPSVVPQGLRRLATVFVFALCLGATVTTTGCPAEPCCTGDSDCDIGLGCFEGECTFVCSNNSDCASDEICMRPQGAASNFGVCLMPSGSAAAGECRDRTPPGRPDGGEPEPTPEPVPEPVPEPTPEEPEPPPPCNNDVYEPNGQRGIGQTNPESPTLLTICPADEDWFLFDLNEGDEIRFRIDFSDAEGDLDLEFYSPEPFSSIVANSTSTTDDEEIIVTAQQRGIFAAKVYGFGRATNAYILFVEVNSPELDAGPLDAGPGCVLDSFEPNDNTAAARPISEGIVDLTICPALGPSTTDDDFFEFFVPTPGIVRIETFGETSRQIDVRNPAGVVIGTSVGSFSAFAPTPGRYIIALSDGTFGASYRLRVEFESVDPDGGPPPLDGGVCDPGPNEPNNSPDLATFVQSNVSFDARLCPLDDDWYQIPLRAGQRLRASVLSGFVLLELRGPAPGFLPLGTFDGSLAFTSPVDAVFFVRVFGGGETDYAMQFNIDDVQVDAGVPDAGPPSDGGGCFPDGFEPNENQFDAVFVTTPQEFELTICPGDEDFFTFDVAEGQLIFASVTTVALGLESLTFQLFGPDGFIAGTDTPDGFAQLVEEATVSGRYFFRAFGPPDADVDYSVDLLLFGDPGCVSDALEPNNTRESPTPAPVNEPPIELEICENDIDFFFVDVEAGAQISVQIVFAGGNGDTDLDMRLFGPEPNGQQLDSSSSVSGEENMSVLAPQTGRYVIQVFGFSGAENAYTMTVSVSDQLCAPDAFEPNNSRFDASFVPEEFFPLSAGLCPGDIDFFETEVTQVPLEVQLGYDGPDGMRLRVERFGTTLGESNSNSGFESVRVDEPGPIQIRISGPPTPIPDERGYTLFMSPTVDVCIEDGFEPNDTFFDAIELEWTGDIANGAYCEPNLDMFRVRPDAGASFGVFLFAANPDLTVTVVNEVTFDFDVVNVDGVGDFFGTGDPFLLVISGPESSPFYELNVFQQ